MLPHAGLTGLCHLQASPLELYKHNIHTDWNLITIDANLSMHLPATLISRKMGFSSNAMT